MAKAIQQVGFELEMYHDATRAELINHIQDFINSGESKNIFDDGHSEEEATILYVSYVIKDGEPSQIRVITELENLIYALHDDCILYSVVIEDNLL